MREMTPEEQRMAAELFALEPDKREGKTRLTVRFSPKQIALYPAKGWRVPIKGAAVLRYVEEPAKTPTGGRYTRRALTVRTQDGRLWYGTLKTGTDVVKLRLAPKGDDTD